MPRGLPTIIVLLLCVAGLGIWSWRIGQVPPQPAPPDTSRPTPTTGAWGALRVMTANIRIDEPGDGDNAWINRRELLVKTLLKYQPDILGCQEVTPAQGAYLHKELSAWYAYYPRGGIGATDSAGGGGGGGTRSAAAEMLGVFSESLASLNTLFYRTDRFDILDGEAGLVLPNEPQANATENTFFTLAILREKRGDPAAAATLLVVDEHFRQNEAFALRCADQLHKKIAGWLAKYPRSGVILLGDINRDRTSKLYADLTAAQPAVTLGDAFDYEKTPAGGIGGGANNGGNYHAFKGVTNRAWPTDLIFVGGGLKVARGAEIVRDQGADGRYPSDHFFTQAGVEWSAASGQ